MRRLSVVSNAHNDLLETRPTRVSRRRPSQMTPDLAKSIFVFALVVWGFLRYPHQHRASKIPVRNTARNLTDSLRIACATIGLGIVPLIYVATGFPRFASYGFIKGFAYAGSLVFALGLWLFYLAHQRLGRNFSVSLDIREGHVLISEGVYAVLRHPMYSAFWLWAIAQFLLLPNWFAGSAGILGFGILYLGRIGQEERLMLDTFGDDYRIYMNRTARIVPWIY
jgi:protein-S-isoprenylcysteine O-methyltransferase Ste14